jgi:ferredoxin--NADP+ reductase
MPLSVAIIGSGPSGFYTADALVKSDVDCRVDVLERLPALYGLIRYGVAPDHETTKKVSAAFARTAQRDEVRYFGNIEAGRDLGVDELRQIYDAVVVAVGAPFDRALGLPGEDKAGVVGAAAFVGWYNGHPDFRDLDPPLDTTAAAVIGNGNVAIDVARVLVKTEAEMAATDLTDYAAAAIRASPLADIHVFGRRGPVEAKFTNVELREMGELENSVPVVDAAQLPDGVGDLPERQQRLVAKNLATLAEFAARAPDEKPKRVHFRFFAAPVEVLGGDRVEGLRLEHTRVIEGRAVGTGEFFEVPCGLVVTAISYRGQGVEGVPFDEDQGIVVNRDGRVADGLYAVGWAERGSTGVIATNRADGRQVAGHILADLPEGAKPGRPALEKLLAERGLRPVSFADWQRIEAAEIANAAPGAPRRKFVTVAEMLAVLETPEPG